MSEVELVDQSKAADKPPARGGVQSIERAAAILEAVALAEDGIALAELSQKLGLHTSTAFHLLKTLVSLGFVTQSGENKRYRIGSRLFALAAGALDERTLLTLATPILEKLSAQTGEAAHLAVRSRADITLIARTAATGMLQMSERAGAVRPAHATAIGKILLSAMPADDLDALLADLALPAITPHTITDRDKLLTELEMVRRKGIAHDRCELDMDVHCIAMPVHDFSNRCIAAIGLSGPVWHMADEVLEKKTVHLNDAAAALSNALGYRAD